MTIILDETIEAYHAIRDHASSSRISAYLERGAFYYHGRFETGEIPAEPPTEALIFGNAVDCFMTEGSAAFTRKYVVKPAGLSFSTNAGKAWKAMYGLDEPNARTVLSAKEWDILINIARAVEEHPLASQLVNHPDVLKQASFRIQSQRFEMGLQCRPDYCSSTLCEISNGKPWSANLKTTADWSDWYDEADPESPRAGRPVFNFGYHRQAALDAHLLHQHEGFKENAHFLIVCEKRIPFRCAVVRMSDDLLDCGWGETERALERIQRHRKTGIWPKSPQQVITITNPEWNDIKGMRQIQAHSETVAQREVVW